MSQARPVRQVIVVAKAAIPGHAKTRIAADVGVAAAAELAAAALLDTLEAAADWAPRGRRLLAVDGSIRAGSMAEQVEHVTSSWDVVAQPAGGLDLRLAAAFASARRLWGSGPAVLIGMDTPQATPDDLERLDRLRRGRSRQAAIGPAEDGGWWGLAVSDCLLGRALVGVPMSTRRTCDVTAEALVAAGAVVRRAHSMRDMDTLDDARFIATTSPRLRVAQTLSRVEREAPAVVVR